MQGLPPFLIFDDGDTYFPLPVLAQLGAILLPHPHWLINWMRNSQIIASPNFEFIYTSPGTGVSTSFRTLLLHTQIQASASVAWLSSALHCPIFYNNLGQNPPFISPFTWPISNMGLCTVLSKVTVFFPYTMYLNCLAFIKCYCPGLIVVHPLSYGTNPSEDDSMGRNERWDNGRTGQITDEGVPSCPVL